MVGKFLPADAEAFAELCDNLRAPDMRELHAAQRRPCREIIAESLALSPEPMAWWDDYDRLICIFGYVPQGPILTPMASPWMLGTALLERNAGGLIRSTRAYVAAWREQYPLLVNFVDARNTASVRYLKAVGFTLDEPAPFGHAGLPFHRFHMGLAD